MCFAHSALRRNKNVSMLDTEFSIDFVDSKRSMVVATKWPNISRNYQYRPHPISDQLYPSVPHAADARRRPRADTARRPPRPRRPSRPRSAPTWSVRSAHAGRRGGGAGASAAGARAGGAVLKRTRNNMDIENENDIQSVKRNRGKRVRFSIHSSKQAGAAAAVRFAEIVVMGKEKRAVNW